jgi:hypothetical protein
MRLTTWRILTLAMVVTTLGPAAAEAQTYTPPRARREFISVAYDWLYTWPQRLADHPLEDLLGTPVGASEPPHDYRTRDGSTVIDLLEFTRRGRGVSVTVYPIGMSAGPTLGVRGSIENLPDIRFAFDGPGALDSYALTNAIAYDVGAGLYVADRAPGWGLGSYAFILGGVGKITSDIGSGRRYFGEGGGGVQSGPLGLEISVKFGWNQLSEPVEHSFYTLPIHLRATVSF